MVVADSGKTSSGVSELAVDSGPQAGENPSHRAHWSFTPEQAFSAGAPTLMRELLEVP